MTRAQEEVSDQLLHLARGIADRQIRRGLAVEIVPLIAHPWCKEPLEIFDALVEAVEVPNERRRLLSLLVHGSERAA